MENDDLKYKVTRFARDNKINGTLNPAIEVPGHKDMRISTHSLFILQLRSDQTLSTQYYREPMRCNA